MKLGVQGHKGIDIGRRGKRGTASDVQWAAYAGIISGMGVFRKHTR